MLTFARKEGHPRIRGWVVVLLEVAISCEMVLIPGGGRCPCRVAGNHASVRAVASIFFIAKLVSFLPSEITFSVTKLVFEEVFARE